ncbi:hypothetical protein D3C76_1350880 [compost metagenome]
MLRQSPLSTACLTVQRIALKLADYLVIETDGSDVPRTVMQPLELVIVRQAECGQVTPRIILIVQCFYAVMLSSHPTQRIPFKAHGIGLDTQLLPLLRRCTAGAEQTTHQVPLIGDLLGLRLTCNNLARRIVG